VRVFLAITRNGGGVGQNKFNPALQRRRSLNSCRRSSNVTDPRRSASASARFHSFSSRTSEDIEARRTEKLRQQGALDISGPQGGPIVMSLADLLRHRISKHEEADQRGEKREETKAPAELRPAA